jgi:Family of unknown function (DUF5767)
MESINIELNDLEPISLSFNDGPSEPRSTNFGSGIELLMNDKKIKSSIAKDMDLGELDELENDLNNLSKPSAPSSESKTLSGFASGLFGFDTPAPSGPSVSFETDSKLGAATAESVGNTNTWDGFGKLNEIPIERPSSGLSDREKRRKKRLMLKKLEDWQAKGVLRSSERFTMESSYEEIEDEYETAMEDKRKKDSIKLQGWWFMTFVNSVEYANAAFDPFGLNLDGWGEQVNEDIDSYEEIFAELHEKYKGGKMAPELSLLLRLGFSAAVVNFTNKALSSATPGFNDVIKQSPELMKMFTDATVNSMSQASPGFAMANNIMQDQKNKPRGPPPPAPVETKNQPPMQRPTMQFTQAPSNRPDISASRGAMFREEGIDVNNQFVNPNQQAPSQRPEMRGPQNADIDNILAGLKTRNVDIHEPTMEDDSMISISSLKDAQSNSLPKRSKRRNQRSDRNTISLDI